ncbi:peptidylprolyl isomerase [Burkholderiaceae bacterium FT117]|uniref:peptidylprolyl isomerase n=1 Tax=Zeimonas sediminis TaxID=2944268 RepID=UPI002342C933|nr:peptidylprolyl isomerase [Zeimonas sediminis]MCM5569469.1 peptidylprolyl isomerase [Zeimonas sediminis]
MFRKLPLIGALLFAMAAPDDAAAANPQVLVKTTAGEFVIELYPDKAPGTVDNFLKYVNDGFYAGTIFHRVIGNFMIQGGGFTKDLYQGQLRPKATRAPIPIESRNGLRNDTGWVAMARTGDPNSATSQFFINVVDNASLNYPQPDGHGYAVFGKVISGMDVVNKIRAVPTGSVGPYRDVPTAAVVIDSMTVVGAGR